MKFQILSDLHCECRPPPVPAAADLILATGDIGTKAWALEAIDGWLASGAQVPLVLGNHEYWGREMASTLKRWRAWSEERPGLHLLDRDSIVVDGVRILGATLWTDYDRGSARAMAEGQQVMRDYTKIRLQGRKLRPRDTVAMHHRDRAWLEGNLARPHDGPTVVITHHAPHWQSSPDPADASDLEALILEHAPELWIHGHTHGAQDYQVGSTRVICNPHGYPGEATGFEAGLVMDVPAS